MKRYAPVLEALALLAVTLPLAVAFHLPTLWFVVPFAVITLARRAYEEYGLSWDNPGSWRFHAAVAALVFLPYVIGHYLFAHWWLGASFHLRWPPDFGRLVIDQSLGIGLPEEFFFRGYLQTHGNRVWGKPWQFAGARCGWGLPIAALVFAVCHLVNGGIPRLVVFFPGLLYGWLRERTGTIAVPATYHAISNILMSIMLSSLR